MNLLGMAKRITEMDQLFFFFFHVIYEVLINKTKRIRTKFQAIKKTAQMRAYIHTIHNYATYTLDLMNRK